MYLLILLWNLCNSVNVGKLPNHVNIVLCVWLFSLTCVFSICFVSHKLKFWLNSLQDVLLGTVKWQNVRAHMYQPNNAKVIIYLKAKALRDFIVFTCLVWISPTRILCVHNSALLNKALFILFYFILMDYFYYYDECYWTKLQPYLLIFLLLNFLPIF